MTTVIGQIKRKGMGGPGAPDIAWQTDSYIVGDGSEPWFQPEFTYHTYRYMEIIGLNKEPKTEDIKGLFLHSNVAQANHFESSSELLNSIQEATQRTFLANLVSVQSDCPAREKFAYGGDLNATNESFIYNFDMQAFYKKTVYDWIDAMVDTCFVDTAPFVGIKYCGISWESAFLITQYYLYLYYNDLDFVKELYDLDIQWMEKVARIHPDGMVDKGLSDHESLEPVPTALTGTCHYLQCARIMSTFAQLMGDKANQRKYEALAEQLKEQIKDRFWSRPIEEKINKQTLYSSLLYHEVIPADEMDAANDSLLTALKNGPSSHFNTGIFGTKYMLEALSKNISPSTVYDVVNSTTYPGWGYMIDRGATTIWETWKESDNTYSNCHPMFGSVTEWFYRWLAGIRPDPENPGFRAFFLTPSTPPGLEYIDCEYHSPFGKISSSWERDSSGSYLFNFSIPEGTTAHVVLPTTNSNKVEMLISPENQNPDYIKDIQSGKFQLTGGEYVYKISSLK
jgi:alpha-L-rhamnosidase